MIRWRWVLVGVAVGASAAWIARPGNVRNRGPAAEGGRGAAAELETAPRARSTGHVTNSPVRALAQRARARSETGRPSYDLLAIDPRGMLAEPVNVDVDRDPAWAEPMEAAIEQHTKRELLALRPDAVWQEARCARTSCVVTYRAKALDPAIASVVDVFIFGSGTMISRHVREGDDGLATYEYRVGYRTAESATRLSAEEYLARQRGRSLDDEALYAKLSSYLADHRAGREVPP